MTSLLQITDLHKEFPPNVVALNRASLEIVPGEVHCLLGANGAGKSTIVKTLAGAYRPDSGEIRLDGEVVQLRSPTEAVRLGISTIFQELDLVPELSVGANLFLGRTPARMGILRTRDRQRQAKEVLERVGAPFGPEAEVGTLSVANQQLTAIARALTTDVRLLVMDEPSASLDADEVDRVFSVIRQLVAEGERGVLFISHRLDEVAEIGDRATVMRNGSTVDTYDLTDTDNATLVAAMIGEHRSLVERTIRKRPGGRGPALHIRHLVGPEGLVISDLEVQAGEIVGLAGLGGAGRTTLLNALFGSIPASMDAELFGKPYAPRTPRQAIDAGVGLVPESRKTEGLILDASLGRNVALPSLRGTARSTWQRIRSIAEPALAQLSTKYADMKQSARALSGGNQQKVVMARWLANGSRLLLLDEPSRGLDVGAKADLYTRIRELADQGAAVLVASSELEELIVNCDTIWVLHDGRNTIRCEPDSVSHNQIQHAVITGAEEAVT